MLYLISRILLGALAVLLAAQVITGIEVASLYTALITAVILGILNIVVRPVLFILTLPVTIVTLGLFYFVINAGLLMFVASFIDGFQVESFWVALLGSLVISVINTVGSHFLRSQRSLW